MDTVSKKHIAAYLYLSLMICATLHGSSSELPSIATEERLPEASSAKPVFQQWKESFSYSDMREATAIFKKADKATKSDIARHETDQWGRTWLMLAANRGNSELVRDLLDAGAEPMHTDMDGKNAACFAITGCNSPNIIQSVLNLLDYRASWTPGGYNDTPLHTVFSIDNSLRTGEQEQAFQSLAVALIRKNPEYINVQNSGGNTPFHLAAKRKHVPYYREIIGTMIALGADPGIPNGGVALYYSQLTKQREVRRMGEDPGETPKMLLGEKYYKELQEAYPPSNQ